MWENPMWHTNSKIGTQTELKMDNITTLKGVRKKHNPAAETLF